jgi:hypothetical protein
MYIDVYGCAEHLDGKQATKEVCVLRFHGELAHKCCSPEEIVVEMMLIRTRISGRRRVQTTYVSSLVSEKLWYINCRRKRSVCIRCICV